HIRGWFCQDDFGAADTHPEFSYCSTCFMHVTTLGISCGEFVDHHVPDVVAGSSIAVSGVTQSHHQHRAGGGIELTYCGMCQGALLFFGVFFSDRWNFTAGILIGVFSQILFDDQVNGCDQELFVEVEVNTFWKDYVWCIDVLACFTVGEVNSDVVRQIQSISFYWNTVDVKHVGVLWCDFTSDFDRHINGDALSATNDDEV